MDPSQLPNLSLRAILLRRPKDRVYKQTAQIVEAHLPSFVTEGHLTYTLVTVIPDHTRTIEASWHAYNAERASLEAVLHDLPGSFMSVLATEVHGGSRPKKRAAASPAETEEAEANADAELEADLPPQQPPPGPNTEAPPQALTGLKGHLHFHCLIYYPTQTNVPLDLSHVKRAMFEKFPKADVNQVHLKSGRGLPAPQKIVRAMTYLLKGIGCPVMKDAMELVHPTLPIPLPTVILGDVFVPGSTCGMRLTAMIKSLPDHFRHSLDLEEAEALAFHASQPRVSKAHTAMSAIAAKVDELGFRLRDNKMWYQRQPGTEHTWVAVYDHIGLLSRLSEDSVLLGFCVDYGPKFHEWARLAPFKKLPSETSFRFIELQDCCYDIRTGTYHDKSTFTGTCFSYYAITRASSLVTEPELWLELVANQYPTPSDAQDHKRFLKKMACLLRTRRPKEPILFLLGVRNSGKSTALKWITLLYPPEAVAAINDSIAPLSQIKGREILLCDEFTTGKISRTNLLRLTDGSTGLNVRQLGRDAEFLVNVNLPQVYSANIGYEPCYKNDPDPEAVTIRFEFFYWRKQIYAVDFDKADKIKEETPYIVFYLNRLLQ